MNNFNWMPLSEAAVAVPHSTWVWYRGKCWPNGELSIAQIRTLIRWYKWNYFADILVCRALVPEVPSFEEESK